MISARSLMKYGGITLAVIAVGLVWYLYGYRGSVRFTLAPDWATVTIDNEATQKTIRDGQRIFLTPGDHTFTFYRNDFAVVKAVVSIKSLSVDEQLVALQPLNDTAREVMNQTPNKERLAEYTARHKKDLFSILPLQTQDYSIDACAALTPSPSTDGRALCIGALDPQREKKAQNKIREIGYDPDGYQLYSGGVSAVRLIYSTPSYKILYASGSNLDKPLVIISPIGAIAQPPMVFKDTITKDMKQRGYDVNDYYIYYTDPSLMPFNTVKPEDVPLD